MQRLSSLFIILAATFATLFSTTCVHAQSANFTITSIQTLTTASNNLRVTTSRVSILNIIFTGPQVGSGLVNIGNSIQQVVTAITVPNPQPFNDNQAQQVVVVLQTFVAVHQALLSTIIGKQGLLAQFGFARPIRVALVALEALVDRFALDLISLIPTRQNEGNSAKTNLDISLGAAIIAYS